MITKHPNLVCDVLIVGGDGTAFTTRTQILARVEAEGRRMTDTSGLEPLVCGPREIFCSVGLAGVFDYRQLVASRELHNRVHVGHLAVQMNGHDGCNRRSERLVYRAPGILVYNAPCLQVLSELL